ncbi:SET domain-containing protein-lysine N-methyltransferase [Candidatus Woesearchaeota archaeon]|nr:MAG: SET domain-containing protein-lysine N-methyltransferase [Candidatus Woesearchaeota archaeon]
MTTTHQSQQSPYIKVKRSRIHGTGVFAKKDIPKGTKIIEYVGEKITKAESSRRSDAQIESAKKTNDGAVYIFELNKRYDIDGNVPWNTAKYINHSCNPNCEVEIIRGHIWIISTRDIKKGEELSYNYGFDLEDYEDHPCRCGAENCVGYIAAEDQWPKLKRKLARKKSRKK